jgi:TatD DNase family protein
LETDTDEQTIQEVYELAAQYKGLTVAQIKELVNTNFRKVFESEQKPIKHIT